MPQIKEVQRFIRYRQEGQKCIIEEVYIQPQIKLDNRSKGNNNKYANEIEVLLMNHLEKTPSTLSYTLERWGRKIGLCTEQYYRIKDRWEQRKINATGMDNKHLAEFLFLSDKKCREVLKDALSNLEKRKVIELTKQTIITQCGVNTIASNWEKNKIEEVELEVLKELGITRQQLLFNNKYPEFYKQVRACLSMQGFELDYYYTSYKIKSLSKVCYTDERVEEATRNVGNRLKEHIDGYCINKYNKLQVDFGESEDFRSEDRYLHEIAALGAWLLMGKENILA